MSQTASEQHILKEFGHTTVTVRRMWAMMMVVHNWRLQDRLPRITQLARNCGFLSTNAEALKVHEYKPFTR